MSEVTGKTKYGIDAFWLKMIAIFGMTLDHIGWVFEDWLPLWSRCLLFAFGGLTFPIMAFLLCEGYRHTHSIKKYLLRLLGFAVITQLPYFFALGGQLNVLFTIALGLLAIYATEHIDNKFLSVLVVLVLVVVSVFCDWGLIGVPMVLLYYNVKNKWGKLIFPILLPLAITIISFVQVPSISELPNLLYVLVGCVLTVPLLGNYNGRRGRSMKYFFYAYYPIHLAVLALLRWAIFY